MKAFIGECRRRQVFQVAGLYVVGAWVVLQVAALAFENWGLPNQAMRYVWIGAIVGLPIALLLGWRYDVAGGRIVRTQEGDRADRALQRGDYVVLGVSAMAALAVTGTLIAAILQTRPPRSEVIEAAPIDSKSIAVLPFEDMSPGRDQAYFSDGIAEEILHWLAAYRDLKVSSRTSVSKLVDAGFTVAEIGAELGVAYVLEGSVRKAGDQLRVTAQLIEASSDAHVWSETYDHRLDDVFAVYDQVSARIAQELKATLRNAAPVAHATDASTYDLYLQGRRLLAERGRDNLDQAIELFDRVVVLDPSFAPGYTGLAECFFWRSPPIPDRLERIRTAAERALELDPGNAEALALLGRNYLDRRSIVEGRTLIERAIDTNPNHALAYRWLGQSYQFSDPSRYVTLAQQAYLRDPLDSSIHWHQTTSLRIMGRYEEALAAAKNRLRFDPDDALAYPLAASIHEADGKLDLALQSYYQAYRTHPEVSNYELITRVLAFLGERDLADIWLRDIDGRLGVSDWTKAFVALGRGENDEAIRLARDNVERGNYPPTSLAFIMMRAGSDLVQVRPILEKGLRQGGNDPLTFNPEIPWIHFVDYVLILYRAGEKESANGLVSAMTAHFEKQIASGIRFNGFADQLSYLYALLLVDTGEVDKALEHFEKAVLRDGFTCTPCIQEKHFDDIRDDPRFAAIVDEMESRIELQRQLLADEGMLLAPAEVMALENFDFDPFSN